MHNTMQAPSNPPLASAVMMVVALVRGEVSQLGHHSPGGEMALQTGSQQSRSYRGNVTQTNTLQRFSVKGKVHPKTVKSHIILKNNWFFSSSSLFSNQFVILELPETWITPDELRLFTFTWTFPLRAERVWGLCECFLCIVRRGEIGLEWTASSRACLLSRGTHEEEDVLDVTTVL